MAVVHQMGVYALYAAVEPVYCLTLLWSWMGNKPNEFCITVIRIISVEDTEIVCQLNTLIYIQLELIFQLGSDYW